MQNIDSDILINAVKDRPSIWNSNLRGYRNKRFLKSLWNEIKDELPGTEVEELKKRWKNLKDQYRKELKKQLLHQAEGPENTYDSLWRYYNNLDFIKAEIIKTINLQEQKDEEVKEILPTLPSEDEVYKQDELNIKEEKIEFMDSPKENVTDELNEPLSPKSDCSHQISTTNKRKPTPHELREQYLEIERKKLKLLETEVAKEERSKSEDYHFFMSILPEVEKLPRLNKLRLRNKINSALMEEIEPTPYESTAETARKLHQKN